MSKGVSIHTKVMIVTIVVEEVPEGKIRRKRDRKR